MKHAVAALSLLSACAPTVLPDSAAPPLTQSALCRTVMRGAEHGMSGDVRQQMRIKGDGNWCNSFVSVRSIGNERPHGEPLLVSVAPLHGEVATVVLTTRSRVSYRAQPGYAGPDTFTVRGVESNAIWRYEIEVAP